MHTIRDFGFSHVIRFEMNMEIHILREVVKSGPTTLCQFFKVSKLGLEKQFGHY